MDNKAVTLGDYDIRQINPNLYILKGLEDLTLYYSYKRP